MYSIVFNFEGKRQSAGKMKKKFSFITKPLSTAFFLCLTLTTNVSSLSSFLSTNKTNLWRTKYLQNSPQEHDDNARRLER